MSTATEFYRGIAKKKSKNLWIRKRHNGAALNRLNRTQGGGRWAKALKRNDPNAKSGADNSEIPHVYLVQTVLKSLVFVCIFLRGIRHCSSKTDVLLHVHRNRRLIRDGSPGRLPRLSHSSWALFLPNPNIFHWLSLKELPGVINLIPSNRTSAGCPLKALTDHTKGHGRFTGSLLPPPPNLLSTPFRSTHRAPDNNSEYLPDWKWTQLRFGKWKCVFSYPSPFSDNSPQSRNTRANRVGVDWLFMWGPLCELPLPQNIISSALYPVGTPKNLQPGNCICLTPK